MGAFRLTIPEISRCEGRRLSHCGKRQAAQIGSLGIFEWIRSLHRKYRSKQNTDMSTSWLFIVHISKDLIQTTTAAEMSQNKTKLYNGSARVMNLCTFPRQATQNKREHYGIIIFILKTLFAQIYLQLVFIDILMEWFFSLISIFEYASLSPMRKLSNSLWSRLKQLALNTKSRIDSIISEKEDNLVRYTHIFPIVCLITGKLIVLTLYNIMHGSIL